MNVKKCVRALLCLYLTLIIAMDAVKAQALKVGDTLPQELWSMPLQVINHPTGKETLTLSEYKDKLIILDFWATWCAPCIKSLTKLDSLQREFSEQLAVIPITYENADKVLPFLTKRGYQLPSVINDSTLKKYFPHRSIPHQVWVRAGEVLAVTGAEYGTRENISKTLNKEKVQMLMKEEDMEFDESKPLLVSGNGGAESDLIHLSVFSKRINAEIAGEFIQSNRVMLYNLSVFDIYRMAFSDLIPWTGRYNRTVSLLGDSLNHHVFTPQFLNSTTKAGDLKEWSEANTYCYNLELPNNLTKGEILEILKLEINRIMGTYMGIRASIERRKVKCLVLTVKDPKGIAAFTSAAIPETVFDTKTTSYRFLNKRFTTFSSIFQEQNRRYPLPILDLTEFKGSTTLEFTGPLTDLSMVKETLNREGFDLIEKEENVDMLVFRNINP